MNNRRTGSAGDGRSRRWLARVSAAALAAAALSGPVSAQQAESPAKDGPARGAAKANRPAKTEKAAGTGTPSRGEGGSAQAAPGAPAAAAPSTQPSASSLIEDRAARKLLTAGDSRMEIDQAREALELYDQVIQRYPRSPVRYEAYSRLGKYHLDKAKDPGKALGYFERAAETENENAVIRGDAMLNIGRCYYEMQKYPQAFAALRAVINAFPGTDFTNLAYFYIGNAHYKLGAYNRAIEAFSKVGTALSETEQGKKQVEIGKRLFVRLADQDLTALPEGATVTCVVASSSGDSETVKFNRVGTASSPNYLAELDTTLGPVKPNDAVLQVTGKDTVTVTYIDAQTGSKTLDVPVKQTVGLVANALASFMDGAYRDPLKNVVIGKTAYVRVVDFDRDVSPSADSVTVKVLVKRRLAPATGPAEGILSDLPPATAGPGTTTQPGLDDEEGAAKPKFEVIDEVVLTLVERPEPRSETDAAAAGQAATVQSGVLGGQVPILPGDVVKGDAALQAQVGDILEVHYMDEINTTGKPVEVVGSSAVVHGSLGEVKVANQDIKDQQLELQTRLKKAEALTNIGRIYKQLGLKDQANQHFLNGVDECERLADRARNLGGEVLETMYVRLWKLYIELDELDKAAAMCLALQREFPESQFVDEALLGLGETAMKKKDYARAITILKRVLDLPASQRKADAVFNIGVCQEAMAAPKLPDEKPNQQLMEQAFLSFQTVFQKYPNSGVAGDAVGKMADFYMGNKDYDRAISTFQQALEEYPDAQFTDRVLYDYGRCLYRMKREDEALAKFRQLMSEYPQSKLAGKAKQIVAALEKRAASGD